MRKLLLYLFFSVSILNINAQLLDSLALENTFSYTSIEEGLKNPELVIRLELRKSKLKNFPIEIFQFKNLQYLDISRNNIKHIPDSMNMLPYLQYLNASKNKLSEIPSSFGNLKNMKWFVCNNNELGALPYEIGNMEDLQYLDLWNNDLSIFPEALGKLKKLKTFDLRHILLNEQEQSRLHDLLPNTTIFMDRPCNCN